MTNPRKVVCKFHDVYKMWGEYREDGNLTELGTYGNSGHFSMTSKGATNGNDQWHADAVGSVKVLTYDNKEYSHQTLSCKYELDDNA